MNGFFSYINQPVTMGVFTLIAVIVLNVEVRNIKDTIKNLKRKCDNRFKWCYPSSRSINKERKE